MRRDKATPMLENLKMELQSTDYSRGFTFHLEKNIVFLSKIFAKLWYCLLLWNKNVKKSYFVEINFQSFSSGNRHK